jgi:hypothetical protein
MNIWVICSGMGETVMNNLLRVFLTVVIIGAQTGCSMVAPTRQRLTVTASEPDARIYVNGQMTGTGTVVARVPRNQNASIMVKKDGCYPVTREVGTTMSMFGIADIIGGLIWLVPFVGLIFPGARELDETNVSVILEKDRNSDSYRE